ncbi:MAG: hypothetical protein M3R27_08985 [Bacteroidota bacterium]|nr:hypothetical protein [Bacteroidota bacterium]
MITYSNFQREDGVDFQEYLKWPGLSHSFLKRERFGVTEALTMTDNIMIGKLVDGILTDPSTVNMLDPLYPIARSISMEVKGSFGTILGRLKKQVSFRADVTCNGFTMPTKGRLDFLLEKFAVIDLKVTMMKDVEGLIEFMGYKNQLWHYAKGTGLTNSYLMIHSIPLKKNFMIHVDCSSNYNDFWAEKVINFGKVAA